MHSKKTQDQALRQEAQEALQKGEVTSDLDLLTQVNDQQRLIEELRIYEAELKVQNEHLQETQEQLELEKERYALLYEHLPLAGLVINKQGVTQQANQQASELFGFQSPLKLRQHSVYRLLDSRGRDWLSDLLRLGQGAEPARQDFHLKPRQPGLPSLAVEGHWIPLPNSTRLEDQSLLLLIDRHEREQSEQALLAHEQALQESNTELEQFAYVASHDLRQPLRMINSYLQMLERQVGDSLTPDARTMIDFATAGAQRLDQMLLSLLEYSRVGRKGEPRSQVSSHAAIAEALAFLGPQIEESQARIDWESEPWPEVYASRDELTRLFQNLISNAIKYHQPDQCPRITLKLEEKFNAWQFCIHDQGLGIDPRQFKRLFKVFQRLQTRDHYEGNGIGLAVCRKIVERHGGSIWVESEGEGHGSRFCFTLPQV
ncbi:ATP-binding protein [Marinospirillum sp.]|uniref:sensor histidine kinase n=1 Tax=Marinospirillum sp. TaxID=2183934 RepID=UPI00384F9C19